jgi:hypothetical protein
VTWFWNEVYAVGTQGPAAQYSTSGKPRSAECPVYFEGLEGVGGARGVETAGSYTARAKALI